MSSIALEVSDRNRSNDISQRNMKKPIDTFSINIVVVREMDDKIFY